MGNYDASSHGSRYLNIDYNDIFDGTADYTLQVSHSGVEPIVYINTERGQISQALKNARFIPLGTILLDPWCESPVQICVEAGNYDSSKFVPLEQNKMVESVQTKNRPKSGLYIGYMIFDTNLNLPLWWTGITKDGNTGWIDATGKYR